ncbi:MAG TPA: PAS domain-containing protein [Victivallales bacterium]|nr:PAS domain-containing protein [Victivallales bacterium]
MRNKTEFKYTLFKELRKSRKITIKYIASELGKSTKTIWTWEKGIAVPSDGEIKLLAKILDINVKKISNIKINSNKFDNTYGTVDDFLNASVELEKEFGDLSVENLLKVKALKHSIEELTKANNRYKENSKKLNDAIDSLKFFIYVKNRDLKLRQVNTIFTNYVNLSKEEIYGRTFTDIFGLHDQTLNELRNLEQYVLKTGIEVDEKRIVIPGSLGEKAGLVSISPFSFDGDKVTEIISYIKDITDLTKALERQSLLEDTINHLDEVIWMYKLKPFPHYIFMSESVIDIYGIESKEFIKKPGICKDSIYSEDRKFVLKENNKVFSRDKFHLELDYRIMTVSKKIRWIRSKTIKRTGSDILFGIISDITKEKQNERKIIELQESLAKLS